MSAANNHSIPISFLHECLICNPQTGELTWREQPREKFATKRIWRFRNARYAGNVAGFADKRGYVFVRFRFNGKSYLIGAHRIIFALTHGYWPKEVDHRNGKCDDNRIANLREVTHQENGHNIGVTKANKSGFRGVAWYEPRRKWISRITVNNKCLYLGYHLTAEDAFRAYLIARREFMPFQPLPRVMNKREAAVATKLTRER